MNHERGIKRGVFGLFFLILLISGGVFAEVVSEGSVSEDVGKYLESFARKGGIEDVRDIKRVDLNKLPSEIDVKQIENNYIDVYELDYLASEQEKKIFVITYSTDEFEQVKSTKNINYIVFGYDESSSISSYLKTSTGVVSGENKGYVMMRSGSITGISTSLELQGEGEVMIKIYKNGKETGFENRISTNDNRKLDYDLQSEDIVMYEAGDVIAVYVEVIGNLTWSDVTTSVELTTN